MKQILLAAALIAVPVIGFTGFHMMQSAAVAATATATSVNAVAALGDMSAMITIIGCAKDRRNRRYGRRRNPDHRF